ncbi:hypothetical protein LINGRAHAP2_LOCUS8953 [Linum grandiflorum]
MGSRNPSTQEPNQTLARNLRNRRGSRSGLRQSRLHAPRRLRQAQLPADGGNRDFFFFLLFFEFELAGVGDFVLRLHRDGIQVGNR